MKKILIAILILPFSTLFSQTENDLIEIIELVIADYNSDTIMVYHKFDNSELISDLDRVKMDMVIEIIEKHNRELDSCGANKNDVIRLFEVFEDSVVVKFEKIDVQYFSSINLLNKKDNKRIKRYTKVDLIKNRKYPLAYISIPLIATDQQKAIVYTSYVCGGLCGNGDTIYLEKINGKWKIIERKTRWIS